jgi:DNA polymerase-3 subunit gamma/tau
MALAIYRKYRPSTFDTVLGQELVIKILKEAARTDKLSHAYLFSGPRGTGKTTTARLIAKVANCLTRQTDPQFKTLGEPCNRCRACEEIDSGRSLDVIEIDAASNRGINEIRDLKENIRVSPSSLRYKVFIIDEAHQLTKEAMSALLKTLEEPPNYVIFILATTEAEKIPPTISSRTQQFYFKKPPLSKIVKKLGEIAREEKTEISQEALELIASSGEGSFRDAESILDQFLSLDQKNIDVHDVEKILGKVGFDRVAELAGNLIMDNLPQSLAIIEKINDEGHNLQQLTKDLIQYLRRVAVLKWNPEMVKEFNRELIKEHINKILEHTKLFSDDKINLIKSLITAYEQMRYSQFPLIPLEIAIIESLKKNPLKNMNKK